MSSPTMTTLPSIIVTGCSSGIGAYCARALKAEGWRVFATVRREADRAPLAAEAVQDLTPPPPPRTEVPLAPMRERGAGRPTKRERRQIDELRGREAR